MAKKIRSLTQPFLNLPYHEQILIIEQKRKSRNSQPVAKAKEARATKKASKKSADSAFELFQTLSDEEKQKVLKELRAS